MITWGPQLSIRGPHALTEGPSVQVQFPHLKISTLINVRWLINLLNKPTTYNPTLDNSYTDHDERWRGHASMACS